MIQLKHFSVASGVLAILDIYDCGSSTSRAVSVMNRVLLLLTEPPTSLLAWHAVELAKALIEQNTQIDVFFYQDATSIANRLNWRPSDELHLTAHWQALPIKKRVCVSAALVRGVTDEDSAKRHDLSGENIADGFHLVGLGELADLTLQASRVIHL